MKKKSRNRAIQLLEGGMAIVICCVLLTACRVEAVPGMDTQVSYDGAGAASGAGVGTAQTAQASLLAEELCIVPRSKNTATDAAITADAALLVNDTGKKALYAQNIYASAYPASVSKLATAWMVLRHAGEEDMVTVSGNAAHITESGARLCGFSEGDVVSVRDLLYGLLMYSGNDAAVALAEHISGSEAAFAAQMNRELAALGVSGTNFVNSHGLHEDAHQTTAYDLYLIAHALWKQDGFQEILNDTEYTMTWKNAEGKEQTLQASWKDPYHAGTLSAPDGLTVIGGKDGTTVKAGSCLVLYAQDRKKRTYIAVILHADSQDSAYRQANHLLEYVKRGS